MAMTEVTSLVLAVLCMLGQVAGIPRYSCGVDSRPHVDGICGNALTRARDNLCFLLYTEYPEHFGRSMNKRSAIDILNYPVHAFANLNLDRHAEKEGETAEQQAAPENVGKLFMSLFPNMKSALSAAGSGFPKTPALMSGPTFSKKDGGELQHVQKRGMVCDCCFNRCRPSDLARYC